MAAVLLFSRASSDGGVVRQPHSPRCFAERESIFLSPPLCFFFSPFLTSLTSTVFLQNVKTSEEQEGGELLAIQRV